MEWRYVKKLEDESIIKFIEQTYNVEMPQYLKDLIINFNGGRPEKQLFDTENNKEIVLQGLISFNKADKANIFIYEELLKKGYIPFAITEFGDVLCINNENKNIELYIHETDKFENINKDIEEFFYGLE